MSQEPDSGQKTNAVDDLKGISQDWLATLTTVPMLLQGWISQPRRHNLRMILLRTKVELDLRRSRRTKHHMCLRRRNWGMQEAVLMHLASWLVILIDMIEKCAQSSDRVLLHLDQFL